MSSGWREGTLTRAQELLTLSTLLTKGYPDSDREALLNAVTEHLDAARQVAAPAEAVPRRRRPWFRDGPPLERAISNLDAAEAHLVNLAPADYVLGQMPSILAHVQCHLLRTDPRRTELERIASRIGLRDPSRSKHENGEVTLDEKRRVVNEERVKIVSAMRAAGSASLREQIRVRSFRNVVAFTTIVMLFLAIAVAVIGAVRPTLIPLCFAPEDAGQAVVVCPTAQSDPFPTSTEDGATQPSATTLQDIDTATADTATPLDLFVVELVGFVAAAVAAAGAIRGLRGSSERYWLPAWLAFLKLPTGAVTAFLGLLLMRGQFVPGLSALDTSAQILAWALVFGYAQQIFTRLVDRQGQVVLDSVNGGDKTAQEPAAP